MTPTTEPEAKPEIPPSMMELGRRVFAGYSIQGILEGMKEGSCSVLLNWSEDDGRYWECSWIVGGVRFTGLQTEIRAAILQAINRCLEHYHPKSQEARRG